MEELTNTPLTNETANSLITEISSLTREITRIRNYLPNEYNLLLEIKQELKEINKKLEVKR